MMSRSTFPLTAVFVLASLLPSFFLFQTEVSAFSSLLIIPAMIAVEFGTCAFVWRFCSFTQMHFESTIMVRRPRKLINSHNSHTALNEIMTNARTKNNRTSYDAAKKQHWLSVYKHELLGRYPLHQGEGEWACQMEKYMMRTTVDRMVERIAEADCKSDAGSASS